MITQLIKEQLVRHLQGGMAFMPVEKIIEKIPFDKAGIRPEGLPYSLWEQLYHLRYAQKDIIDFSFHGDYQEAAWPDDYWPEHPGPGSEQEWEDAVRDFFNDRKWLAERILDERTDLMKPLENDPDKSLLREVLLIIEHNAYHTGQMLVIMRVLGILP
jgi:uncharacterized damage-inducible protein DinB